MDDLSVKNSRDDDITEDDLTPLVIMDGKLDWWRNSYFRTRAEV